MVSFPCVAKVPVEPMGIRAVGCTCCFNSTAPGLAGDCFSGLDESLSDASPALPLIDYERGQAVPRSSLVSDRNEICGSQAEECVAVGRDEDVCLWVCEQSLEPSRQIFLTRGIAEQDKERADRPQVADLGRANGKRHSNCILTALRQPSGVH